MWRSNKCCKTRKVSSNLQNVKKTFADINGHILILGMPEVRIIYLPEPNVQNYPYTLRQTLSNISALHSAL